MERLGETQIELPIPKELLTQEINRVSLVDKRWIEENTLRSNVDPNNPEVRRLLRAGVKANEIIVIWPGQ